MTTHEAGQCMARLPELEQRCRVPPEYSSPQSPSYTHTAASMKAVDLNLFDALGFTFF